MAEKQYKKLGCLDVKADMGCAFEVRAETEDEVMRLMADHGKHTHNMAEIPAEVAAAAKAAIKTVSVNV